MPLNSLPAWVFDDKYLIQLAPFYECTFAIPVVSEHIKSVLLTSIYNIQKHLCTCLSLDCTSCQVKLSRSLSDISKAWL